jgi:hypothetical protein
VRATIHKLNMTLPYCVARDERDILFAFLPPPTGLHLGDVIESISPSSSHRRPPGILVPGRNSRFILRERAIHDLRLPAARVRLAFHHRGDSHNRLGLDASVGEQSRLGFFLATRNAKAHQNGPPFGEGAFPSHAARGNAMTFALSRSYSSSGGSTTRTLLA